MRVLLPLARPHARGNVYKDILLWVPPLGDNMNMQVCGGFCLSWGSARPPLRWKVLSFCGGFPVPQPLYDQVAYAIRAVDPYRLIAFESVTWEVFGLGSEFGFKHAPGGPQWANRSVLSYHNSVFPTLTPDPKYVWCGEWCL